MPSRKYELFRQSFPVVIGSLSGVSFGTMLGWPSAVYPLLVDKDNSPILINWDQTSLIAGFMMEGNIVGTVFSSITVFGSRIGILIGSGCQVAGWIAMYYTQSVAGIGVARGLVGFGNGFSLGQIRMYVKETCEPSVEKILMQYMPLSLNIGVVFVYVAGTLTTFRNLSIACLFIPTIALFLFAAVPKKDHTPPEEFCMTIAHSIETKGVSTDNQGSEQLGFIAGLKDKEIRRCLFLSWFIIFIPQYTGGAANIVYSQIVHMAALNTHPQACSITYSLVFLLSTFVSLKYTNKFPRKPVLVASCIICSLLLCSVCFYFYFMIDLLEVSTKFAWSPLVLLSIYNFFHSVGINIIPILLVADIYPKNARVIGSKFYVMYFSLSAVLSTKIFQVLFSNCGMHTSYAFLSSIALASAVIIACFVKEPSDKTFKPKLSSMVEKLQKEVVINKNLIVEHSGKYTPYYECHSNHVDLKDEIVPVESFCTHCQNVKPSLKNIAQHIV